MSDLPSTREAMIAARDAAAPLHDPVMLKEVVEALDPSRGGDFLDGTFGAGGYARALLEGGAERVIALDRDPEAIERGRAWAPLYGGLLILDQKEFSGLDISAEVYAGRPLNGVVLDIGVSSMQIDAGERGFSFMQDGPLDMRMGDQDETAADLVATLAEAALADVIFQYGEERASRRIAKAIVAARDEAPIETTSRLTEIVESVMPRPKPGQPHSATRTFQALRIAVNDELGELGRALEAAERALGEGGVLAVVTFHSLEDRMVKRFFQERTGRAPGGSRHQPELNRDDPTFLSVIKGAATAGEDEVRRNPRARSAKLRAARRTAAPARDVDLAVLGAPPLARDRA
ncbi:MAG: 16S rRNA (cytosine(1402)-N(4))-methyltransferase RsmH [Pseudomonadota bacterium]